MTGTELITSVLRRIAILADSDAPTAEQVEQHIESLNDMMAQWEADGIDLAYSAIEAGTEKVYLPTYAVHAVKCGLAISISSDYDKPVTREMYAMYDDARRVLVRNAVSAEPVSMAGVTPTASAGVGTTE